MSYAKKTCNTCGFRDIQPNMYRTEKSRVTGSSKTKITSGNLVGFALGQKNSKRKISNTLFANNKRQYTRKSVVWMCYECSGTGDSVRDNVRETIKKGESVFSDARATGWLSKPADEATQLQMAKKMESLRRRDIQWCPTTSKRHRGRTGIHVPNWQGQEEQRSC